MTDRDTPEGVDPALWAEFQQLFERVHALNRQREIEMATPPPPTRRMVLDVPEEWFLLFAWVADRERDCRHDINGPTGLTAERISAHERVMRHAVSRYSWQSLNNHFHTEAHDLATASSALLRPFPKLSAKEKRQREIDAGIDPDIPF